MLLDSMVSVYVRRMSVEWNKIAYIFGINYVFTRNKCVSTV